MSKPHAPKSRLTWTKEPGQPGSRYLSQNFEIVEMPNPRSPDERFAAYYISPNPATPRILLGTGSLSHLKSECEYYADYVTPASDLDQSEPGPAPKILGKPVQGVILDEPTPPISDAAHGIDLDPMNWPAPGFQARIKVTRSNGAGDYTKLSQAYLMEPDWSLRVILKLAAQMDPAKADWRIIARAGLNIRIDITPQD